MKDLVFEAFSKALNALKETRLQEGGRMVKVIESHLETFKTHLKGIEKGAFDFTTPVKNRLREKFEKEFSKEYKIDEGRFMQEVIYTLEKLDFQKINRLKSFIKFDEMLKNGGK